jgi:competence protein ComEC
VLPKGPLDYLWQLFTLGLAAQLGTAAISIHYFHQFPLYFWLSGLIIVPLASLALWLGLAVLLFGELPLLGSLLTHGLDLLVLLMNQTMGWIADLPAISIAPLYLSANATLLIAGLLVGSVLYYHHRSRVLAWMLIGGAALLLWQQNRLMQQNCQQQEYLVHTARSGLGITLVQGQTARTLVSDSSLLSAFAYAKNNYLLQKNVRQDDTAILPAGSYSLQWNRQTFVWLREAIDSCQLLDHPPHLVLIDSPLLESQLAILQQWRPDAVVVSPALPYREQKNWQVALRQSGIPLANTIGQRTYYHPIKP